MTRKLLSFVMLLIILSQGILAGNVNRNEASIVARNFYYEYSDQSKSIQFSDIQTICDKQWIMDGQVAFYIVNMKPAGFVIVAAEDNVTPILGYSFEGTYTSENLPPQMSEWFDGYAKQIIYHRNYNTSADATIVSSWKHFLNAKQQELHAFKGKSIQPLLISTWDQGGFYNELCPQAAGGPGGRVWAGCVATAMAQVMYYYRYPVRGTGSHGYNSSYGYLSANFGNTTYEWDKMLNALSSSNLSVATLLYHCGVSVNMMYSPTGSGAYSNDAADAFKSYFGYASTTHMEDKDNYTDLQWANLLISNLDLKRPMYYHGFGSGGHAFNVDGYQGTDFFHFNWGWSGSYNGYFYLNNLNPGGNSFTNGQGAIVDIYPGSNYPDYCVGTKTYTSLEGTIEDGSGPNNYQANSDCNFLIDPQTSTGDSVEKIQIIFNRLDTENGTDKVIVYAGNSTNSPVAGTFSGDALPSAFIVQSNKVLVHFTSNSQTNSDGFFITYKSKTPQYCQGVDVHTNMNGTIEDGSGNKNYTNHTVCQWLIHPANVNLITLNFNSFNILSGDFVEVYEYDTITSGGLLLGRFDGNTLPPSQVSHSGAMFVIFYSNTAGTAQGFTATYSAQLVGIAENSNIEDLMILPNPAKGYFTLVTGLKKAENLNLRLNDVTGKTILDKQLSLGMKQSSTIIDISAIRSGLYFLQLIGKDGVTTRKVVIQ